MSVHTDRAYALLQRSGALAGNLPRARFERLAAMPKREMIEIMLRLGSVFTETVDDAEQACQRVLDERRALRNNGII